MKIGFYDYGIGFRGTTRSMYAYAKLLQKKHDVTIFFDQHLKTNNLSIATHILRDGINVCPINNRNELKEHQLEFLYHVTSQGAPNNQWIRKLDCPKLLHQVGYNEPEEHANTTFAYTSAWQSAYFTAGQARVLPYLIEPNNITILQNDARVSLGIPTDVTVLGRHGGQDTWNLSFASEAVARIAAKRSDIWFMFVNTPIFCDLPNVKFFHGSTNTLFLETFLSACDAMLHARWEGETFGLACAEFLIRKKPIITWSGSREKNHLLLADSSAITFNNQKDLNLILEECTQTILKEYAQRIPKEFLLRNYGKEIVTQQLYAILSKTVSAIL